MWLMIRLPLLAFCISFSKCNLTLSSQVSLSSSISFSILCFVVKVADVSSSCITDLPLSLYLFALRHSNSMRTFLSLSCLVSFSRYEMTYLTLAKLSISAWIYASFFLMVMFSFVASSWASKSTISMP